MFSHRICSPLRVSLHILIPTILVFTASCTPASSSHATRPDLQADVAKDFSALRLNQVVILPLVAVGQAKTVLHDDQLASFTDQLVDTFDRETSLSVVNHEASDRVKKTLATLHDSASPQQEGSVRSRAVRAASALGTQGVVVGEIGRYEELEGSRFGGNQLAAIGFRILLLDGRSGRTLWSASYEHSDEPLSDNLLRLGETLRGGVGFRPAKEILQTGFRESARNLQGFRTAAEEAQPAGTAPSRPPAR